MFIIVNLDKCFIRIETNLSPVYLSKESEELSHLIISWWMQLLMPDSFRSLESL